MNIYLDASVLVALFTNDPFSARADAFLRTEAPTVAISDFAAAEFASAVARRVRMAALTVGEARTAFAALDLWVARAARRIETSPADIDAATGFLRRLDLTLRTPDAINIAIAERTSSILMTFDTKMSDNAKALGLAVAAA